MKRRKKKIYGKLDIQNPKPKWQKTIYLDGDVIRETIHDGSFSPPSPTPPTPPTPTADYMYFEAVQANSTVSMMSTLETAPNLEYSRDGETWQEWQHTSSGGTHTFDTLTLTAIGDRVYLRGNNPNGFVDYENEQLSLISMSGSINSGGNIMSLLDKTMVLTEVPDYGFMSLFCDLVTLQSPNTALLTPPDMSLITKIGLYGCSYMYTACTSLTYSADMSSLTYIGDYGCNAMYASCSSLGSGANMPVVAYFGSRSIGAMYADITDTSVLCDKDPDTQEVTSIKFEFPDLPITAGFETITDYTGLIHNMTER